MTALPPADDTVMRVTGTTDAAVVAAVLAAVSSVLSRPRHTGYERWRRRRVAALRTSSLDRL